MKVRTLSYQAVKEKFKSDHQEPSNSQNKNVAKVMARKSDSDITLATAPIALNTFLWQELKVLQQVLKDFFQNSFGKVVLRPWPLLGHPTITLAIAQIRLVWLSSVSQQLDKHPIKISTQNFNPSLRYWPFLLAKVMATGPNFGHIKICSLIELPVDVLNDGA